MHLKHNKKRLDVSWIFQRWKDDSWKGPAACLLSCGRAAVLCPVKPQKTQLRNKVKSISESIFSEWLIQMERESELRVRGGRGDGFSYKRKPYRERKEDRRAEMRWEAVLYQDVYSWDDVSCCQIGRYIWITLYWGDGFIFMACLSAQDIYRLTWQELSAAGEEQETEWSTGSSWHITVWVYKLVCIPPHKELIKRESL